MNYKNKKHDGGFVLIEGDVPRFNGNSFTVTTEPGAQASRLPEPIGLIAPDNKCVDVKYEGSLNNADNTVPVAALDLNGPEFRKFDLISMYITFRYLGLGMKKEDRNKAYNVQFRITQMDAIAAAYAAQLTELGFMKLNIQSDIPALEGVDPSTNDWTGSGQFAFLIFYQTVLQNIAAIMGKYNTLLTYNDYLISMGYRAESAYTTRLLSLLKKQAVWTLFDQLGNLLQSEFFDLDFYKEITMLNTVPARKANAVSDPLITLIGDVHVPSIAVWADENQEAIDFETLVEFKDTDRKSDIQDALLKFSHSDKGDYNIKVPALMTYFPKHFSSWTAMAEYAVAGPTPGVNDARVKAVGAALDVVSSKYSNIKISGKGLDSTPPKQSFQGLCRHIMEMLDPAYMLKWARTQWQAGSRLGDYVGDSDAATKYLNELINHMIALIGAITSYRNDTSDIVTFLRVLQTSTSLNKWEIDTPYLKPNAQRAQARPVFFKLVYDILTSSATSGTIIHDPSTRNWKIFTWWHKEEGIPKYDAYEGGLIMAVATRGIPVASGDNPTYEDPEYMIPVLFEIGKVYTTNRLGKQLEITRTDFKPADIQNSVVFAACKLMELPPGLKVPSLNLNNLVGYTTVDFAQAVRLLTQLFGLGYVVRGSTNYQFLDHNMEGLIGREFPNCNNMALDYINGRAPFRVTTGNGGLGFTVR